MDAKPVSVVRRRVRELGVFGFATGIAISFLAVSGAQAGHMGPFYSDDSTWTYKESFVGDEDTAFHAARSNEINPTDLNSVWWSGDVHSGGMADVNAWPSNLDPPLGGTYWCDTVWSAVNCRHGHMILDTDTGSLTLKKHLACHEVGHSVGLGHTTSGISCMRSNNNSYVIFDWHDIGEINAKY